MEEKFVKASDLLVQESFLAKLKELDTDEAVQALFAENGVNLTVDDISKMVEESEKSNAKGELGEDDLEGVSGGIILTTAACFTLAAAGIGFYSAYGYRKSIKGR